jgi:hypothetical protein
MIEHIESLDWVQARLPSPRQLQSATQEELDALLPSAEGATARSPRSAAKWEGGAFKGEL